MCGIEPEIDIHKYVYI